MKRFLAYAALVGSLALSGLSHAQENPPYFKGTVDRAVDGRLHRTFVDCKVEARDQDFKVHVYNCYLEFPGHGRSGRSVLTGLYYPKKDQLEILVDGKVIANYSNDLLVEVFREVVDSRFSP